MYHLRSFVHCGGPQCETVNVHREVERNEAALDYTGSKESAQRMARLYGQLKTALIDAGLAKE